MAFKPMVVVQLVEECYKRAGRKPFQHALEEMDDLPLLERKGSIFVEHAQKQDLNTPTNDSSNNRSIHRFSFYI